MPGRAGGRRGPPDGVEKELRQAVGRGKPGEKTNGYTNLLITCGNPGFLHWVFSKSPGISWFDLEWCRQCRLFIDCFPGFSCRSSHHCCPRCSSPQRETSLAAPKSRPEFEIWIDFGDSHSWRNHALGPVSEHQTSTWDFNILQIVAFFILFHVSPPGASTFCLPRFVTGVGPRCPRSMSLSQSWCESAASTMIQWYMIILQIVDVIICYILYTSLNVVQYSWRCFKNVKLHVVFVSLFVYLFVCLLVLGKWSEYEVNSDQRFLCFLFDLTYLTIFSVFSMSSADDWWSGAATWFLGGERRKLRIFMEAQWICVDFVPCFFAQKILPSPR